jgi:programmed cell death 6-interacting protein
LIALIKDKSQESEAAGRYGEQVGWLAASVSSIKAALDKQIVKYLLPGLETDLKAFYSMVEIAFGKSNKENDKIYMETVPKELPQLQPARMVNPITVPDVSYIIVQRPVFLNLVPFKVHEAVSKYAYKKDTLVKNLCSKISDATALAHTYCLF